MPQGVTFIRIAKTRTWVDICTAYGASLSETGLSRLMTPAPNKEVVENDSDLQHGKRVTRDPADTRKNQRNFSVELNLIANSKDDFLEKYGRFCREVLDKGFFDIRTTYQPNTVYRVTYLDCAQFSEFMFGIAKFTLSLNEPDPTNRDMADHWNNVDSSD